MRTNVMGVSKMKTEGIEARFAESSYSDIAAGLNELPDDDLIALLDAKSVRVGDTAASFLMERNKHQAVIDAILCSRIETAAGRLRATNVLLAFGKTIPRAEAAYLRLINDNSDRVVDNALFGLVFLQNKENVAAIESAKRAAEPQSKRIRYYEQAASALISENPFAIAPYFRDVNNVWQLDQARFANKIGWD
jgi:hypothetical protein